MLELNFKTSRSVLLPTLVATCFVLLLIWMLVSKSRTSDRTVGINRALARGPIGGLSEAETNRLRKSLKWLTNAAGVRDAVLLNEPLPLSSGSSRRAAHCIHFFSCTPAVQSLTLCGDANAVYDSELDAVFIDVGLVRPNRFLIDFRHSIVGSLTEEDLDKALSFLRVYLRFVVLHELGHRKLHGGQGGAFDAGPASESGSAAGVTKSRRRELEADAFALQKIVPAYETARKYDERLSSDEANLLDVGSLDEMPLDKRAQISFINAALTMCLARQVGWAPHSLFKSDASHPTYADRTRRLLLQLMDQPGVDSEVRAHAQAVDGVMDLVSSLPSDAITEYVVPKPSYAAAWTDDGVSVVSNDDRFVYRFSERVPSGRPAGVEPTSAEANLGKPSDLSDDFRLSGLVGSGLVRTEGSRVIRWLPGTGWTPWALKTLPGDASGDDALRAPQPAERILLAGGYSSENLVSIGSSGLVGHRKKSEIVADVAARLGLDRTKVELDWERSTITKERLFVSVWTFRSRQGADFTRSLAGWAALDSSSLKVVTTGKLIVAGTERGRVVIDRDGLVLAPASDGQATAYVVSLDEAPDSPLTYGVWSLSDDKPPTHVLTGKLLSSGFRGAVLKSRAVRSLFHAGLRASFYVPPGFLVLNLEHDSVHLVDLKHKRSCPIFLPGAEELGFAAAKNGRLLIWEPSRYRFTAIDCTRVWPPGTRGKLGDWLITIGLC